MHRLLLIVTCGLVLIGVTSSAGNAAEGGRRADREAAVAAVLRHAPADTTSAVIVPDLDRLDNELEAWLAGMDRAGLLLGADPLEQILILAGIPLHVLEEAALLIAQREGGELVVLVPVTDAAAFLDGNFTAHDAPGQWRRGETGAALRVRVHETHVALTEARHAPYDEIGDAGIDAWWARTAPNGRALLDRADVLVVGDPRPFVGGINALVNPIAQRMATNAGADADDDVIGAATAGSVVQSVTRFREFLFGRAESAVAVDFDPLGLVLRTHARFSDGVLGGDGTTAAPSRGLDRLPLRPYLLAGSIDLGGLGAPGALEAASEMLGPFAPPAWARTARSVQWAAFPPPSGLGSGLLNDACVLVETADRAGARQFVRAWIERQRTRDDGYQRAVTYRAAADPALAGTVDAYEVRLTEVPDGAMAVEMLHNLTFGPMGWRGFVADVPDGLALTFSRRASTFDAIRAACAADGTDGTLGADPVISAMRGWMPAARDLEAYLDVSRCIALFRDAVDAYPGMRHLPIPRLDGTLPPVGFGAALDGGLIESTVILPAGVVGVLIDWGMTAAPVLMPNGMPSLRDVFTGNGS